MKRAAAAGAGISGRDATGKAAWPRRGVQRTRRTRQQMQKLVLAILTVAALAAPGGARASAPGCTALGANQNTGPISCTYTASGPGTYIATTVWPFQISASSDRGASWHALVDEQGFARPSAGALRTRSGDLVRVQIGCWNDGRACLGYCPPGAAQAVNCTYEGSRGGAVTALDR